MRFADPGKMRSFIQLELPRTTQAAEVDSEESGALPVSSFVVPEATPLPLRVRITTSNFWNL